MVRIAITYSGGLLCSATHAPSGKQLVTDAPADIGGGASSFSPTDLVATALGTCIATTLDMVAKRHGLDLKGMGVEVTKEMSQTSPRRIKRLVTHVHMPLRQEQDPKGLLERTAHACPVHQSLHPETEIPIIFHWQT